MDKETLLHILDKQGYTRNCGIFFEQIDHKTANQLIEACDNPLITNMSAMPDMHYGNIIPIGSVVETEGYISSVAVGADQGCGMSSVSIPNVLSTDLNEESLKLIQELIIKEIPTGYTKHKDAKSWGLENNLTSEAKKLFDEVEGLKQLGTLGGGNHFIELGVVHNDALSFDRSTVFTHPYKLRLTIHSGSRGAGAKIATMYNRLFKEECNSYKNILQYVSVNSSIAKNFINDLNIMMEFALHNRALMTLQILDIISRVIHGKSSTLTEKQLFNLPKKDWINKLHNTATYTEDGKVLIRKGATDASLGNYGVIPGNMSDGCAIVIGKGNELSLNSSSHGAGRVFSRSEAKKTLNVDTHKTRMNGILCDDPSQTLDESAKAYKDFYEVLDLQKDLINIIEYSFPILNRKDAKPSEEGC